MKQWNRIFGIAAVAAGLMAGRLMAQDAGQIQAEQLREQLRAAREAADSAQSSALEQSLRVAEQAIRNVDMDQIRESLRAAQDTAVNIDTDQIQEAMRAARQTLSSLDMDQVREQLRDAQAVMPDLNSAAIQDSLRAAQKAMDNADFTQFDKSLTGVQKMDWGQINQSMKAAQKALGSTKLGFAADSFGGFEKWGGALAQVAPGLAFQSDAAERARENRERLQEQRQRARETIERAADTEQRKIDLYRDGTNSIDEGRYERAVSSLNRLMEADNKWSRIDGAYYWKAYALNKIGRRDDALAAIAEMQKQFPQSRWVNDAKALQVEIQQAQGRPVSPQDIDDQDIKLVALNALMNSDPDRAVPLVEKVLSDPKNNLGVKAKALYAMAQSRNEKAHDIVAQYAKNGSNPDLQIRAIGYVGAFRTKDGVQVLADVYAANNDVAIRRAVLRGMLSSRDTAHLLNAAKNEQNPELRREAIRDLGQMQAVNELAQMYSTETSPELKDVVLTALFNGRATDRLIEIARNEKNAELRGDAIRYLANMRGEKSADALAGMYSGESDKNVKEQIIRSLGAQGAGKQLVEVLRNEKDGELKAEGVRWLGRMKGSKEASDYLMEILSK